MGLKNAAHITYGMGSSMWRSSDTATRSACAGRVIGNITEPLGGHHDPFDGFRQQHPGSRKGARHTGTRHAGRIRDLTDGNALGTLYHGDRKPLPSGSAYHEAWSRIGRLGDLVEASAAIRNWRPQSYYDAEGRGTMSRDGGGVLLTQGIHAIDLLLNYAGTSAAISAFVLTTSIHRMETEDLVTAAFSFEGGAIGSLNATTCAYPGLPERIELIGTKGTAVLTGNRLDAAFIDGTREMAGGETIGSGAGAKPMAFGHEMHRALIRNFIDAIELGGKLRVKGDDALNAHRFIDAVLVAGTRPLPDARPDR